MAETTHPPVDDRRAPHVKAWNFSATSAELWNACPYAWSMKYELGVDEVRNRPLRVGGLLAMTVERYLTHCAELRVPTDLTSAEEIARAVYAEQGVGLGLDALDEVLRIMSFYVEQHTLDLDHLVGVEVWLPPTGIAALELAGRRVVGKLDELYMDDEGTGATVVDAKSNWSAWTDRETREKLQARLYPILVAHSFPTVDEVRVIFDFVRHGVRREVRWTRSEIDAERQNLEALSQQMQKPGLRPATPGDHCAICGYVSLCPVFKSARQNGVFVVPTNEDEARRVTETVLVLERGLDQRREALRAYAKEHGPVHVNGVSIGYFKRETPRISAHAFVAWAKEHGIDPLELLELPSAALKRLMKKRPLLRELTTVETETRFATKRDIESEEAIAS